MSVDVRECETQLAESFDLAQHFGREAVRQSGVSLELITQSADRARNVRGVEAEGAVLMDERPQILRRQ
jgi:hypothetical protein